MSSLQPDTRFLSDSSVFEFLDRDYCAETGVIRLRYALDGQILSETVGLPERQGELSPARATALEAALDLLHWTAGLSYWKARCSSTLRFSSRPPDRWQANWLTRLYREGLAEFAYRNELDPDSWPSFPSGTKPSSPAFDCRLRRRTLVPMGGGKDSLVAWSRLATIEPELASVQIGRSALISEVAELLPGKHWIIDRKLDPALADLNRQGAWNGHVPVTAINSCILTAAALILDYDRVAFANERSADEASLLDARGRAVNHQFSKSRAFEFMFDDWVRRYVARDLAVFSILRRDRELAICRDFAGLDHYHARFSSCNRNFHLDGPRTARWCGHCPKCLFVFLGLAPFLSTDRLSNIFGQDLLSDADLIDGFGALLALDGSKPFECVGEAAEARAAVAALATDPAWSGHVVVKALADRLSGLSVPDLSVLCEPAGEHRIPEELINAP